MIVKFKSAGIVQFETKDIFRVSHLSLLGVSNSNIENDREGEKLFAAPLLRDQENGKVVIAHGYHRLYAAYSFDEDALIPYKII